MSNFGSYITDAIISRDIERENDGSARRPLFDRLDGRPTLDRVHKLFYDKIFAHPWLKQYFDGVPQALIETQQSDFMSSLFGGPKSYSGRMPIYAHSHMMITDELFDQRHELLKQALSEAGVAQAEADEWLKIDGAFRKVIVKKSIDECKGRFATDTILDFSDPNSQLRKAS